jgi:hypothetical protein
MANLGLLVVFIVGCVVTLAVAAQEKKDRVQTADAFQDQLDFLSELYDLTSGSMWKNNTNWLVNDNTTSICDWYGITCSGKWVEKLDLNNNGLGGPLPNAWERLLYLDSIDLSSNK